jgi:hypothetical protein
MVLSDDDLVLMANSRDPKQLAEVRNLASRYAFVGSNRPKSFTEGRFDLLKQLARLAQRHDKTVSNDAAAEIYDFLNQFTITRRDKADMTGGKADMTGGKAVMTGGKEPGAVVVPNLAVAAVQPGKKADPDAVTDAALAAVKDAGPAAGLGADLGADLGANDTTKGEASALDDAAGTNPINAPNDKTTAAIAVANTDADAAAAAGEGKNEKEKAEGEGEGEGEEKAEGEGEGEGEGEEKNNDSDAVTMPPGGILPAPVGLSENDINAMFVDWKLSKVNSKARIVLNNYKFEHLPEGENPPADDRAELLKRLVALNKDVPDVEENIESVLNKYSVTKRELTAAEKEHEKNFSKEDFTDERVQLLEKNVAQQEQLIRDLLKNLEISKVAAALPGQAAAPAAGPAVSADAKKASAAKLLETPDSKEKVETEEQATKRKMEEATKKLKIVQPWPDPHFTRETVIRDEVLDSLWKAAGYAGHPPAFVSAYTGPFELLGDLVQFASAIAQNTIGNDDVRKMVATGAKSYLTAVISKFLLDKEGALMEKVALDKTPGAAVQLLQKILTSIAMPVAPPVKAPAKPEPAVKTLASQNADKFKASITGALTQAKEAAQGAKGAVAHAATESAVGRQFLTKAAEKVGIKDLKLPETKAATAAAAAATSEKTTKAASDAKAVADLKQKHEDQKLQKEIKKEAVPHVDKVNQLSKLTSQAETAKQQLDKKAEEMKQAQKQAAIDEKAAKSSEKGSFFRSKTKTFESMAKTDELKTKAAASAAALAKVTEEHGRLDSKHAIAEMNLKGHQETLKQQDFGKVAAVQERHAADAKAKAESVSKQADEARLKAVQATTPAEKAAAEAEAKKLDVQKEKILKSSETAAKEAENTRKLAAANMTPEEKAAAAKDAAAKASAEASARNLADPNSMAAKMAATNQGVRDTFGKIGTNLSEGAKSTALGAAQAATNVGTLAATATALPFALAGKTLGTTLQGVNAVTGTTAKVLADPLGAARQAEASTRASRAQLLKAAREKIASDYKKAKDSGHAIFGDVEKHLKDVGHKYSDSKMQVRLTDLMADVQTTKDIYEDLKEKHEENLKNKVYEPRSREARLAVQKINEAEAVYKSRLFQLQQAQVKSNNNDTSAPPDSKALSSSVNTAQLPATGQRQNTADEINEAQDRARSRGGRRRKKPTLRFRRTPTRQRKGQRKGQRQGQSRTRRGRRRFSMGH